MPWTRPLPVLIVMLLLGCEGANTPDSNIQTFQTIDEIAAQRRQQQRIAWKQVAIELIHLDRPDLEAQPEGSFAITLAAEGLRRDIDLTPAWESLVAQPERSDAILREHLAPEVRNFDRDRLEQLSASRVRELVHPMLISGAEADQWSRHWNQHVLRKPIAGDLCWSPAIKWQSGSMTPIPQPAMQRWGASQVELESTALTNLKRELDRQPAELLETTEFGPTGRVAVLKAGVEPAVILLPEFLAAVRGLWQTEDDLAILATSRDNIRLQESRNTKLLDMLYPAWKEQVERHPSALSRRVLLLNNQGLTVFADYNPPVRIDVASTQPLGGGLNAASRPSMLRPPTTRPTTPQRPQPPRPYIAR